MEDNSKNRQFVDNYYRIIGKSLLPLNDWIDHNIAFERWAAIGDLDLFNDSNSAENEMVFVFVVSETGAHAFPVLDASIHCLVSGSSSVHLRLVKGVTRKIRSNDTGISSVSTVSDDSLGFPQHPL